MVPISIYTLKINSEAMLKSFDLPFFDYQNYKHIHHIVLPPTFGKKIKIN